MTVGVATSPDSAQRIIEELRGELDEATRAACDAYRDSSRLVRILTVISRPSSPRELLDEALDTLSTVFNADIATMVRNHGERLVATRSCGIAEDDEAFTAGWPIGAAAAAVMSGAGAIASAGDALAGGDDVPPALAAVGIRSAAWIPLWSGGGAGDELVILFRADPAPFTPTEVRLLESVAFRLGLAVQARERSVTAERLASAGHHLARHLDVTSLLATASRLFAELANATASWIVDVGGGLVTLRGWHGDGPRAPVITAALPGWRTISAGGVHRAIVELDGAARSVLALAVPDGGADSPRTLLFAFGDSQRPFLDDTATNAQIFASHLRAAMVNAELHHALRQSESSLRLITDSISDLIAVVDGGGRFLYASPSHERELAHEPELLVDTLITDLAHPQDAPRLRSALERAVESPKVEYRLQTGWETWVWVETAVRAAPSADGTIVLSSRLVDDRKRLEDELRVRATHDPLTGLANRTLTGQRLDEALASDASTLVGLLFCDLDKFKAINDKLGHEAGDELLRSVAERLRRGLRAGDLLARFGGDEFVFLLDGVRDIDDVNQVGKRVTEALAAPFLLRGEWYHISVSVGGVCGGRGQTTASDMLREADAAMYSAKDRGHGMVAVFDDVTSRRSLERLDLRSDVTAALDRGQLTVHYQPVVDLELSRIVGFEALLRWRHPERGLVPPELTIPLAEETGAIVGIGDWILERACRQLSVWNEVLPARRLAMSVNLSAAQVHEPGLETRILDIIERTGVDATTIWLDVTQRSAARDDVMALAGTLRTAGLRFALEDFGVSDSDLGRLARFPAECLKIDKALVRGMTASDGDREVVRAILAIGSSLGLVVTAEGIESIEQRRLLRRLGCHLGQGYLISRPVPAEQATALLLAERPVVRRLSRGRRAELARRRDRRR